VRGLASRRRDLYAGRAGFHVVLRIEVRPRGVGRSGGVHDRKMLLLPERFKGRHRRMQSEKAVEIEHGFLRDVDGRTHGVVARFAVRHNNVESVGGSALKDHDQTLRANAGIGRAKGGARQETGSAVVPTTASAPLRRKMRRVMDIKHCSWPLALGFWLMAKSQ